MYNEFDIKVTDSIKKNRLYGLSNPKIIRGILRIPYDVNLKKLINVIDDCYDGYYIEKSKRSFNKDEILCTKKKIIIKYKEVPSNKRACDYRWITTVKEQWLKATQKRLNKILTSSLMEKNISILPYLHSSVKKRSYVSNAFDHTGDKYVLAIDLKDFYPSVSLDKLHAFFCEEFKLPSDIAMIYSLLSTIKGDDGNRRLGQGISQSSTLAFLVNYKLFNYLYNESEKKGIQMSIYVDDITFSSESEIPQDFIDRLFGLIKSNGMAIKKEKVHSYKLSSCKNITGVYITRDKTRVANRKKREMKIIYAHLLLLIEKINNIDDYYEIYNLYLKFYGNYQHIKMVEKKIHSRYEDFKDEYDKYFPKGIMKLDKNLEYRKNNIKNCHDLAKIQNKFSDLKSYNNLFRD